jgi:hypothetical protein
MNAERKRVGTKAKIRAEKERQRRIATVIFLAIISLMISLSAHYVYTILNSFPENQSSVQELIKPSLQFKPENPNPELRAAIVDQLSLTFPNQTFIETAASTLTRAGYTVDYFRGEKVTVEFYRNLPTHNYSLIILRVHSAAAALEGKEFVETPVSFFTSEDYSQTRYVQEQLTDQLLIGSYSMPQPPYYFGITPKFVTTSMKGAFQNTAVVMMGCEGLNNTRMAEAFIEKGAKVYVGWTSSVSASYTDQATAHLLQHLIAEKQTIKQAVDNTIEEVGPDQTYNSQLIYYPP